MQNVEAKLNITGKYVEQSYTIAYISARISDEVITELNDFSSNYVSAYIFGVISGTILCQKVDILSVRKVTGHRVTMDCRCKPTKRNTAPAC